MQKRILILMSKTGGGHWACAEALKSAFFERFGDEFRVDIVDLWMEHMRWPLNQLPKTYRFMVDGVPWLWELFYRMGERPQATKPLMAAAWKWTRKPIQQAIEAYDPDLIISVHPLLQEIPLRILAKMTPQLKRQIPFVTVVTDLISMHPTWFHKEVSLCFVTSDEAYHLALQAGLKPQQLRQFGLPIRTAFGKQMPPKETLYQKLHMQPNVPAVLLVGGAEGMGAIAEIAQAVSARLAADSAAHQKTEGQLVVICGRNQKLRERLSAHSWPIPTIVNGFVENVWEWMAASDCIITKAGPGTIAEALALGLPILLSGYVPGQEEGNVTYIVKNGAGAYSRDPEQIAEIIGLWLGAEREHLVAMAERARSLGRPEASLQIVEEIARFVRSA